MRLVEIGRKRSRLVAEPGTGGRSELDRNKNEQVGVFKSANSRHKQDSHLLVLKWLHKRENGTKKCVIKQNIKFGDYETCLKNKRIILWAQQKFKSDAHTQCHFWESKQDCLEC